MVLSFGSMYSSKVVIMENMEVEGGVGVKELGTSGGGRDEGVDR